MSLHSMMTYMAVCDGRVEPQVDICLVVAKIQGQDFPYLSGGFFNKSNARGPYVSTFRLMSVCSRLDIFDHLVLSGISSRNRYKSRTTTDA
jgi:hypothetical protein